MSFDEQAIVFSCGGQQLFGVLAAPDSPARRGVLVAVGGPQYRVGSHRQFLLLSRDLAAAGVPVLRFDYRGMGDSEGEMRSFEAIDDDLLAAIGAFFRHAPALREVVIWGLCDGASAALMYAHRDPRICGLMLANPWVRTPAGLAHAMLKHYYGNRLIQREFWRKLVSGRLHVTDSLRDLVSNLRTRVHKPTLAGARQATDPFPQRMAHGLHRFGGRVLICLSENDLTAQEFEEITNSSPGWKSAVARPLLEWRRLPNANHTFSRRVWRQQVSRWTIDWINSW